MKSRPVQAGQIGRAASQFDTTRDDARGGSFLLAHQQLGTLTLGTNASNNQVVPIVINGTTITATFVTSIGSTANNVLIGASATASVQNLVNFLRRPDLTSSTQVAASVPNQALLSYVGWAWPGSSTNIVPFSLNKNANGLSGQLSSFNITGITVTSGTWTAQTMQLYVEDGTYFIGGTRYLFTGGATPTVTAPVSHPRIDVLTIDTSGTLAWTTGTENASPVAPSYPANKIPICELYNVVGETALYDNENQQANQGYIYNDVRPTLLNPYGQFILDPGSEAQGDILYVNSSLAWTRLPAGTSGQFLQTQGASANPQWAAVTTVVATGSKSGSAYSVSSGPSSPGAALDSTNLKIVFAGSVGQIVKITAFVAVQLVVAVNQSISVSIVDVTNSTTVGSMVGGGGVTTGTFNGYGLVEFYYQLQSTSTTFEMYGWNQSGSNTLTVYNASTMGAVLYVGVTQSASSGASLGLTDSLTTSSYPWFTVQAI
jgi:hypothetical protein